jgi:hypothetical protein
MEDWTVIGSSDFDESKKRHFAYFRSQLEVHAAAPNSRSAKRLQKAIGAYCHILEKLKKLEDVNDMSVLPENELAYIQDDPGGSPIYSLIDGDWRCLFQVDIQERLCIALSVELMLDNLRVVEKYRHRQPGNKLSSLQ